MHAAQLRGAAICAPPQPHDERGRLEQTPRSPLVQQRDKTIAAEVNPVTGVGLPQFVKEDGDPRQGMAFLYQLPSSPPSPLFNVEQAVGANGANANGDVKLVQYFLKYLCGQTDQQMPADGYIGYKTASVLRKYQEALKSAGNDVLVDGRVDRCCDAMSKVSKTRYTILLMNQQLQKYYSADYARLPQVVPINPYPRTNPDNPIIGTFDASRRTGGRIIGVSREIDSWATMSRHF